MSESIKTIIYCGAAGVALVLAVIVGWPRATTIDLEEIVGSTLFEKFDDPLEARSFEIVRYDDVRNDVNRFTVNQVDGRWVIPSHANYPADAEEQMKKAATVLIGLEVLGTATEIDSEHEMFGVVEPQPEKLEPGAKGVGTLVSMKNSAGDALAELIIGKEVKDVENGHFVRVPGQSTVMVVKIQDEDLSTKFEDWIEKDLLQLSSFDVEEVTFNDYSLITRRNPLGQEQVALDPRLKMTVSSESSGDWDMKEFIRYSPEEASVQLAESEELNTENLNQLKNALDDLEIIDVRRKPEGLGADLRAGNEIKIDLETFTSLKSRGFYAVQNQGATEILSTNGDLTVTTKDGVQYVLRFGDLATSQDSAELGKLNRYLMVAVRVAEHKFPYPELEEVPEKPAGPDPEPKKEGDDATQKSEDGDNKDESNDDAKDADDSADPPEGDKDQPVDKNNDDDAVKVDVLRAEIEKRNQRKIDEWEDEKKRALDKVRELEIRFADWYYVISEDVYEKVHLGRSELIKERENVADEGFGVDAFRKLEGDGLKKGGAAPSAPQTPPPGLNFPTP